VDARPRRSRRDEEKDRVRDEFIEVDRVAVELVRLVVTEELREEPREEDRVLSEDFVRLFLRRRLGLRWMGEGGGLSLSPVGCAGSSGRICVMVAVRPSMR
jgi:hypothetical protein